MPRATKPKNALQTNRAKKIIAKPLTDLQKAATEKTNRSTKKAITISVGPTHITSFTKEELLNAIDEFNSISQLKFRKNPKVRKATLIKAESAARVILKQNTPINIKVAGHED